MAHVTRLPFVSALVLACGALAPARAQISLPPKPENERGNLAPHHLCTVCGARNYTVPANAPRNEADLPLALCATCQKQTPHRPNMPSFGQPASGNGDPRLRLPPTEPVAKQPGAPAPAPAAETPASAPAPAPNTAPTPTPNGAPFPGVPQSAPNDAASFIFAEIAKAKTLDDPLLAQAVDSLCGMGEIGRARARAELTSDSVPRIVVAARTLARCGGPAELDALFSRARERLPVAACAPYVAALASADPVRATPAFFCELLEHPIAPMRVAAEKVLRKHIGPELVPLLVPRSSSTKAEARLLALGLLADIGGADATEALFAHLADPKSSVAQVCVHALGASPSAEVEARLLGIAFRERWILREHAYALIAILEREERQLKPVLDERHVEPLLEGMRSSDVFVAGTCASALAAIGFRSAHPRNTAWLDRDVVDRLVYVLSGKVFHDDVSALLRVAVARLTLVTGQEFASDGPRWVEWWVGARDGFFARRAWIEFTAGDEVTLTARWRAPGENFTLLGPAAKAVPGQPGEVFYLTEAEARALTAVLQREGLFGAEKLPGVRGKRGPGERELAVGVAGRGKEFLCGADAQEPWFERAASASAALREKNRWQLFAPAGRSQFSFWQEQAPWWALEHSAHEREQRMKHLVLAALPGREAADRGASLAELARLYATPGVAEASDFEPLLALLRDEHAYGERPRRLARLALEAARAAGNGTTLDPDRARRLIATLGERFPNEASDELEAAVEACSPALVQQLAADERAPLRAASAVMLARDPDPAAQARLVQLLSDRDSRVEIAAVNAAGAARLESARTELLVRARLGLQPVRVAALHAIGKLGGEYVLDALLLGAQDADAAVRTAAAKGLAELADASAAPLLVSMLSEGSGSVVFGPAREGLLRLGDAARQDLLRVLHKTGHPARREAALILAEQGAAEPLTALVQMLATTPGDARVANELAVLSCVDFRGDADPVSRYWTWYDGVTHEDALQWFRAALERASPPAPDLEALRGRGTRASRLYLVEIIARPEPWLAERARRELARLLGRDLGALPAKGSARDAWLSNIRENILASRDP